MRRRAVVSMLAAALGCSGGAAAPEAPDAASPDGAPGEGDAVAFAPYPGWPAEVAVRQVGSTFKTYATKVALAGDGRIWLLRQEWRDNSPVPGTPVLERYGPDGHLEKQVRFADATLVPDFVVHPSGELTAFLLAPDETPGRYRLVITRLSADGATLRSTLFDEEAGPGENLYYDDSGVHEIEAGGPVRLGQFSHVVGLADGEGVTMLAWTHGIKLYRLRPDGGPSWGALVMPPNFGMAFMFIPEVLVVDERGRVHVALQIFQDDVHIFADHFHRAPLQPAGSYDVVVQRFEPDGEFSGAQLFGGPGGDAPTGMTARDGTVLVTGSSRVTKHDQPNRTKEWDLFVLRGSIDDGSVSYQLLDLARDDFAWAMAEAADGTIYLAGRTDYVQVDTNSEVEDGKGLLLALSPDLARRTTLSLPGPRDVQLRALRLTPDGRVVFAGSRNGPLTHTEPSLQWNEGVLGVTRLAPP